MYTVLCIVIIDVVEVQCIVIIDVEVQCEPAAHREPLLRPSARVRVHGWGKKT